VFDTWGGAYDGGQQVSFRAASETVHRLMVLERGAQPPPVPALAPAAVGDLAGVDAALARIQVSGAAASWGEKGPYALAVRVRTALVEQGIERVDPAVSDALDVVAGLLENVLTDPLVQPSAKPLLRRIGLSVARAALADSAFFASDAHPTRRLLDRLGRLAVPDPADSDGLAFTASDAAGALDGLLGAALPDRRAFARAADALGRRTASLADRELAMALRRGSVQLDEVAGMSIVDRAMCRVLQQLHGKLEHKANRDPCTGLVNRKRLTADLARVLHEPVHEPHPHHVCVLGLSCFEDVGRRYGVRASDRLVERFARLLERQIGGERTIAYLGGGRFAVLLEHAARADVVRLMERHRRSIELSKCEFRSQSVPLAVSIGVVVVAPGSTDPVRILAETESAHAAAAAACATGLQVQDASAGTSYEAIDVAELIAAQRLALRCQRVQPLAVVHGRLPYYEVLIGVGTPKGASAHPVRSFSQRSAPGAAPNSTGGWLRRPCAGLPRTRRHSKVSRVWRSTSPAVRSTMAVSRNSCSARSPRQGCRRSGSCSK